MAARDTKIRDFNIAGDEVLDFPGLPGEDEGLMTNSVSADAYLALKSAFKELKDRYLDSEQRCNELSKRVKKKGAKDSALDQAHRERDDMLEKLKKSYAAFQEKYTENEERKNKIEELGAEIETLKRQSKEKEVKNDELQRNLDEITKISEDFREQISEVEQLRKLQQVKEEASDLEQETLEVVDKCSQTLASSFEALTLDSFLKSMEDYGLQVVERCETLIVLVVDKERLKTCLEACADKNVTEMFCKILPEGDPETKRFYSPEEYNLVSKKHKETEEKVIRLKQKIEDQAQEIRRLRKLCSDVMHVHSKCNTEKQKTLESEAKDLQRNLEGEADTVSEQTDGGVAKVNTEMVSEKRFGDMLRKVVAIIAQLNELYKELDTQGQCVQQLIQMTEASTHSLSTKTRENYVIRKHFLTEERHRTRIDDSISYLPEEEAKHFSIPVQETQRNFRVRTVGAPIGEVPYSSGGATDEESGAEVSTAEELSRPVEEEPTMSSRLVRAPPVEGASARSGGNDFPRRHEESSGSGFEVSRPSFDRVERTEWAGESDIEVIEENDQQLGATSMQGRLCPVCDSYFHSIRSQDEFEQHVRSHFDDE